MRWLQRIVVIVFALILLQNPILSQSLSQLELSKLHPRFQRLVLQQLSEPGIAKRTLDESFATSRSAGGSLEYGAIIYTSDLAALNQLGIHFNSREPDFITSQLTVSDLIKIARLKTVSYIDPGTVNYPLLDVSVPETGAQLLHNGFLNDTPYKGKGAIVLIYDSGIDWKHLDFRSPDDTTKSRILYIWDQTLTPEQGEKFPLGFSYGVEYTKAEIDNELDGTPEGFVRTMDTSGHGTHVAGIAAGNGLSLKKKYIGMAPEADIIVVKGGNNTFSEVWMIDGLTYAQKKASALGRPVVVNWSIGSQEGPHDGSRAYEISADNFSQNPGHAVVVAAGNEGGSALHISGTISKDDSVVIKINVPSYQPKSGTGNDKFVLDIWFSENQTITAIVHSPNGISVKASPGQTKFSQSNSDGKIELRNIVQNLNGNRNINLRVSDSGDQTSPPQSGIWTLTLTKVTQFIQFDGWLASRKVGDKFVTLDGGNSEKSVSMPGTSSGVITVGSYVSKWSWPAANGKNYTYSTSVNRTSDISTFSGIGPTAAGRQKPELVAPGQGISSTMSSGSKQSDTRIQPGKRHFLTQGTSMATPHVTGAVALLLAEFPGYTASQVKTLLIQTADQDGFTGNVPNYTWGYGKLDIFRAMVKAKTGSSEVVRKIFGYDQKSNNSIVNLTGSIKYAVRISPDVSGRLTGIFVNLTTQRFNPVAGQGPLLCEVFTSESGSLHGIPGQKLGITVAHDFSQLSSGINNYINMIDAGVDVTAGTDYQIVLSVSNSTDTLVIRTDKGATVAERSSVFRNGQWANFGDPQSGFPAMNLRIRAEVTSFSPATAVEQTASVPKQLSLWQNYPNPFNPSTHIRFSLSAKGHVSLSVFNLLGQLVATLIDKDFNAGEYAVQWRGQNQLGQQVPSGVYIYHLKTPFGNLSRKMILMR